ncbi:MAG: hypothetical protein Q9208_003064 [Pyrenodesmia sp. 3 TL-2023]
MASAIPPAVALDMIPSAPPPKGVTPDFIHGDSLSPEIIAVSAISSALALALLCIRLYSTLRITRSAWYDDPACACALVFSLAYVGLIISTRDHAKHGWDLPVVSYTSSYFKIILAETIICSFAFLCSKLSMLLLLHRLFTPIKSFRYCVYFGMLWATIISGVAIILAGALCAPSIVEVNVAIMVACMPACASFFRFFATKTDFLRAVKARIASARSSVSKPVKSPSGSQDTTKPNSQELPVTEIPAATVGRYWKIKNVFPTEKNHRPPQITANDRLSTLPTGRLGLLGTSHCEWPSPVGAGEKIEATRCSHENGQPPPAVPHGWV